MTDDPIREQLSALADGELDKHERELLLARLSRDPALRATWERYHAMGEALRGGLAPRYPRGLAARVAAALAVEPDHRPARDWRRPLIGAALAAGVATVAVVGMRMQLAAPPGEVVPTTAGTGGNYAGEASLVGYDPALQARLNGYVARHGGVGGNALPSVAPHVQIAAQDPEAVEEPAPEVPKAGAEKP
jgi:sigma-E factor negative regulatory protein RseA